MKPQSTSVCSARRLALRSSLLRTLSTQSSVFEVSEQKTFFIHSIIDHRNDLMQMLSCRVWHLSVFGILGGFVVVLLCRLSQQVIFIHFHDFTDHYFTILNLFFLLFWRSQVFFYSAGISTGTVASLIILFFVLARLLPKVKYLDKLWGPISLVSCVTNVLFLFFCSTEKPCLFVPCWWLVIFCLCHPARLQESQCDSAATLACGLR